MTADDLLEGTLLFVGLAIAAGIACLVMRKARWPRILLLVTSTLAILTVIGALVVEIVTGG
jgi:hypothetical protein